MEGPTPVSALIHAATMVTAGVYLIARMHPLFEQAPAAADVGRDHRLRDDADRGHDRPRRDRPQARHRVLDDVADRLHGHGRLLGRLRRGHVPPDDARLLQGAALHGGRLGDRRDGRQPGPRPDVGLPRAMPFTFGCMVDRRPRAVGHPAVLGLLLQGRDPGAAAGPRRLARRARRARLRRRAADRDLHVPDDLPRLPRRAVRGGARARGRAPLPRARAHQPGHRRGRGHRRRLPRRRPPHRRARGLDEDRDGRARGAGDDRRGRPDPQRQRGAAPLPRADVRTTRASTRRSSRPTR